MKLRIRRFEEKDLTDLYTLLSDAEVMRYIEPPFSPEQTRAFLHKAGLSDPPLVYAVDEDDVFIGYVIYHDYDAGSREIGWILKKDTWGKGYAKELTRLLVRRAKSEGKSAVIECAPEQAVSKHIALASGFAYVGRDHGCDVYQLEQGEGAVTPEPGQTE